MLSYLHISRFVLKTVAIVYLQLPGTRGAAVLYDNVIRPVLARSKQSPTQARYSNATSSVPVTSDRELQPASSSTNPSDGPQELTRVSHAFTDDRVL